MNRAEELFSKGNELILSPELQPGDIEVILTRLLLGQELSAYHRSHVLSMQEFYRAHQNMFLERSLQTAHKWRELRYIRAILKAYEVKNEPVLDAGCGLGRLTIPLLEDGFNVYGLDVSPDLIAKAQLINPKYSIHFRKGDLLRTLYPEHYFSAVLMMWHVISEISHALPVVFAEMSRILKSGGILLFDIPDKTSDSLGTYYQGKANQEDYTTFLAKIPELEILKKELEKAGFRVLRFKHFKWGIHKYVVLAQKL